MEFLDTKFLHVSDALVRYKVRAKYYVAEDGTITLACVQKFAEPRFRPDGWELSEGEPRPTKRSSSAASSDAEELLARATRRAKTNAFDMIMCNSDLDTFVTFTYAPEQTDDKADYDGCYKQLGVWLSNRVQRRDLKYVCVPERTKKGDIHFHAIMNRSALKLVPSLSPYTGKRLQHNGNDLWNVSDWKYGFTSAEIIGKSSDDRRAVAKYIFKYMGKQMGQKIGGRYALIGGDLRRPIYRYADDERDLMSTEDVPTYERNVVLEDCGVDYHEWVFI